MNDRFYDYYDVLKVSFHASRDEIRGAFREAALRWHPDHNRDNEAAANEMMRLVNEAWDVLGNPESRAEYNHAWMEWHNATGEESSHTEREEYRQYSEWEQYHQYPEWEEYSQGPSFLSNFLGAISRTPVWVQILIWLLVIAFTAGILAGIVWAVIEIVRLVVELVRFIVSIVVGIALLLGLLWLGYQMSSDDR